MNRRLPSLLAGLCMGTAILAVGLWIVLQFLYSGLTLSPAGSVALMGIACLGIYLAGRIRAWHTPERAEAVMRRCFILLFCLYLLLLLCFTLFDDYFSRRNVMVWSGTGWEGLRYRLDHMTNFTPFATVQRYLSAGKNGRVNSGIVVTNLIGNLAAFAPFALFLPLLFPAMKRFWRFALVTCLAILLVECGQLVLGVGFLDVDDLILNLSGACLCYALLHLPPVRRAVRHVTLLPY